MFNQSRENGNFSQTSAAGNGIGRQGVRVIINGAWSTVVDSSATWKLVKKESDFEPNEKIRHLTETVGSGVGVDLFVCSSNIFEGLLCPGNFSKMLAKQQIQNRPTPCSFCVDIP